MLFRLCQVLKSVNGWWTFYVQQIIFQINKPRRDRHQHYHQHKRTKSPRPYYPDTCHKYNANIHSNRYKKEKINIYLNVFIIYVSIIYNKIKLLNWKFPHFPFNKWHNKWQLNKCDPLLFYFITLHFDVLKSIPTNFWTEILKQTYQPIIFFLQGAQLG